MSDPKPELTPEEKAARTARARENGRKGGRPPKTAWNAEQRLRAEARAKGEGALRLLMDYWIELVEGKHANATHDHRLRAAENIANRCGLPIRTEQNVTPGLPAKSVFLLSWTDPDGKEHRLPATPDTIGTADEQAGAPAGA